MHPAGRRVRRDPGGKRDGEGGGGPDGDMAPEAATADILLVCGHGRCVTAGSAPTGLGLWPGHTGPSPQGCPVPSPPNDPPPCLTQWVPTPAWEGLRGLGLGNHSETQSRTNHTAQHQQQEPRKAEAGRGRPPPRLGGGAETTAGPLLGPCPGHGLAGQRDQGRALGLQQSNQRRG